MSTSAFGFLNNATKPAKLLAASVIPVPASSQCQLSVPAGVLLSDLDSLFLDLVQVCSVPGGAEPCRQRATRMGDVRERGGG